MNERLSLRVLGENAGILPQYVNFDGSKRMVTTDMTYEAILKSLGLVDRQVEVEANQLDHVQSSQSAVRCLSCLEKSPKRQIRGVWINLYSIRSETNWGIGDFGDLRRLVPWAANMGLDFIAMNPLHALRNRGHDVSPYRPVSRLYRNEIYLELDAIPEFETSWATQLQTQQKRSTARDGAAIDYGEVSRLKRELLQLMYEAFKAVHGGGTTARGAEFQMYLNREGQGLQDFAIFSVLDDRTPLGEVRCNRDDWTLLDSRSPKVQALREQNADKIGFECYLQFELDRQLSAIASLARDSGMAVGLMGDLAIGTSPDGSDPWAFPDLFVKGVSIGAPPDDLGPTGQNWSLPPMNPRVLIESDFAYWRKLLQNNMSHMGVLRIDHVMGLLRQFWIPDGIDGSMGAYMKFPAEQLFSILAEESLRSGTIIVGEDLGTVPEGFRELLHRFGVLSTRVVRFERDWDGGFKPSASYPHDAYVVAGTHDMAPLAGYRLGRDLRLRAELDHWPDSRLQEALNHRNSEWHALQTRLKEEGFGVDNSSEQPEAVQVALNGFLAKLPSCMVAASLDDLAGEIEPVNVPGFGQDRHRSWSRRMTMPLESIFESQSIKQTLAAWRVNQ